MRLNRTVTVLLVALVAVVLLAWIEGGQKPQRLIEQPVVLPGAVR